MDDLPVGLYELPRRSGEASLYCLPHPLAQHVLGQAKSSFRCGTDIPRIVHPGLHLVKPQISARSRLLLKSAVEIDKDCRLT